jgi:hypothetical protein
MNANKTEKFERRMPSYSLPAAHYSLLTFMFHAKHVFHRLPTQLLTFLMCTILVVPMAAADPTPLSENVTDNLINRLVERGVITKQDADGLLKQAEDDAVMAHAQVSAAEAAAKQVAAAKEAAAIQIAAAEEIAAKQVAAAREIAEIQIATAKGIAAIEAAGKQQAAVAQAANPSAAQSSPAATEAAATNQATDATGQVATAQTAASAPASAATSAADSAAPAVAQTSGAAQPSTPAPEDDTVRVTYVPEIVKAQLRDEIKTEVLAQARQEHWAAPNAVPSWVSRFTPFGDIRIRYENDYYPAGNATGFGSSFWNFNAINTGAPFDNQGVANPPYPNLNQYRTRLRLRARLGTAVDLNDGFTAGFRVATGENDSPVTENQSLGAANSAQGGDFSKYAIWLDRAFLKYEVGGLPDEDLALMAGRFDNPFFATSMIWADDLGFDGVAAKGKYPVNEDITPFLTIGAFPVFNTDFNFGTTNPAKFKSEDKWLYAAQLGTDWEVTQDFNLKVGGAYYYFQNIEGKVSTPFTPLTPSDSGNTDDTRPSFAQRGNSYIALRNIEQNSLNQSGQIDQFQYFGLATPFHELAFTGQLDYNHFDPFQVSLGGEYVNNLAFHRRTIERNGPSSPVDPTTGLPLLKGPVNNNAPNSDKFGGGNSAWIVSLKVGKVTLAKRWDWNINLNYRDVESDSVVDGFTDSDFGGGGTNFKGYTIGGNLAVSSHVCLGLRWMSATSIAGPTFKNDLLQCDLNAKF